LAGDLRLAFLSGFQNSVTRGDVSVLIDGASDLSGAFDNIASGQTLWTTDRYGTFQVYYGQDSLFGSDKLVATAFALPEPTGLTFLALGGLLALRRPRRR
jgi:hypothetical protein